MTDADVDGSHIRTLILTLFFRQMKPLIESGYVYIAKPPLYKVRRKKKERYIETEEQLDQFLVELGSEDVSVKLLPDRTLTQEELQQLLSFAATSNRISNSLRRCGLDPVKYFKSEKNSKFPIAKIIVHDGDNAKMFYAYNDQEESEIIAAEESRIYQKLLKEKNPELTSYQELPEDPVLKKMASDSIEHISVNESSSCAELSDNMKKMGFTLDYIFNGEKPMFAIFSGADKIAEVNSISSLFDEIKKVGKQGIHITRYKGLGEMNAEQLWETTMNPANRKMIKVTMQDAFEAERIFALLMGDDVDPRREYIEKYAEAVKDLDI